jgi:phage shock protein A
MPTDTEKRIKELLGILKENGTNLLGEDGKALSQILNGLEQEIDNLKKENTGLKQEVEDLKIKDNNESSSSEVNSQMSNPNSVDTEGLVERLNQVVQKINDLEEKVKNMGAVETEIDLKKEFKVKDINNVNLKADEKKPAANAEMLNKALKKAFMPDPKSSNSNGYELYPFGARTLNDEYTPKQ